MLKLVKGDGRYLLIDETDGKCRIEVTFDNYEEAFKTFEAWVDELARKKNDVKL